MPLPAGPSNELAEETAAMKVNWKVQPGGTNIRYESLQAVVVDGHHLNGNDSVIELGSIEKRFLEVNIRCTREFHQGLFWKKADFVLDQLALPPEDRESIEEQLTEKIPRPGCDWALWGVTCIPRYE